MFHKLHDFSCYIYHLAVIMGIPYFLFLLLILFFNYLINTSLYNSLILDQIKLWSYGCQLFIRLALLVCNWNSKYQEPLAVHNIIPVATRNYKISHSSSLFTTFLVLNICITVHHFTHYLGTVSSFHIWFGVPQNVTGDLTLWVSAREFTIIASPRKEKWLKDMKCLY